MSLTLGIIASSRGNIVPPLDTFGGAAAAYSTRLLSSAYGGSAVRVRRSFDNAEQDIGFSGGAINETALMNFVGYQNLFLQSQTFENAYWINQGLNITSNSTTAPDGTLTAESIISNSNGFHVIYRIFTGTNTTHTASVYAKAIAGSAYNWVLVGLYNGTSYSSQAYFNVVTGEIGNVSAGTVIQPVNVGNGWWRIVLTGVLSSAANCEFNIIPTATNGGGGSYTGDGTSGVYLWGAQLNVGTTAQPYQVTTSAARSGDGFVTKWYTQDSNGENLLLQSQTFNDVSWSKTLTNVSENTTTAPDGTLTADSAIPTATLGTHYISQLISKSTISNTYALSCYVKANGYNYGVIAAWGAVQANQSYAIFDLVNGTIASPISIGTGFTGLSSSITNVGSGWYRVSITLISDNSNQLNPYIRIDQNSSLTNYAGNGTSGLFIWGAQLSQSSWLQPYQVTTTAAILRRDASQSTAANQPRIVGGGVIERENGKASIRFDGVDDFLSLADITYTTTGNQYVSAVFTPATAVTASTPAYTILNANVTVDTRILYFIGNTTGALLSERVAFLKANSGLFLGYGQTITDLSATPKLQSISFDPPSLFNIFQNSIQQQFVQSTDGPLSASQYPSTFGRIGANQVGSAPFFGDMQEIILYGTSRSANRADIDRNVGAYYQTQWTGASSGLLDQFGGAAAAYSLRNLSSSYRGPLIRVRRSSDNAETDIGGTYSGDLDVASLLSFTGGQNLLTNSEDFTNANWGKTNVTVTANASISPDGTLTADALNETAGNGIHSTIQNVLPSTIGPMTGSVYLKAKERSYASVIITTGASTSIRYGILVDLQNGTIIRSNILSAASGTSHSISSVGNGWYRVSISINCTTTAASTNYLIVGPSDSASPAYTAGLDPTYLGVAGSGVYIWGAQLNTGILQPYIPTTTAAVNGANAFVTKWYTQDNNYQNLVLYSEQFENASYWITNQAAVSANVTTDPFGGSNADKFLEVGGTAQIPYIIRNGVVTPAIGSVYNLSCYLKASERQYGFVNFNQAGVDYAQLIDLSTGLSVANVNNPSYSVVNAGNGWWRLSISIISTSTSPIGVLFGPKATPAFGAYNTTLNSGIFIFGAQLSEGAVLQPYTATTTTVSQRRDAIQATAASQPRIVNSGGVESEGNKPSLFFDGVDDRLQTVNVPLPTYISLFLTAKNIGSPFFIEHGQNAGVTDGFFFYGANTNMWNFRRTTTNGATPSGVSWSGFDYSLYDLIYDGTGSVDRNTIDVPNGTISGTSVPNSILIDNLNINSRNNTTTLASNSELSELVIYPSALTSARPTIQSNINSYYQIYWQGNGTALLDNYSGASAAYSLRNLSSAYTGPLIRVRRSNDNVERDIYGTFGGDLDIASLVAFVGANSGFVTTWYDQSGSARHATQGTAANQPRIVNAGVVETDNGKPAVFIDGAKSLSSTITFSTAQMYSHVSVHRVNTIVSFISIISWITAPSTYRYFLDGRIYSPSQGNEMSNHSLGTTRILEFLNWTFGGANNDGVQQLMMCATNGVSRSVNINKDNINLDTINSPFYNNYADASMYVQERVFYNQNQSANQAGLQTAINNYYKIY